MKRLCAKNVRRTIACSALAATAFAVGTVAPASAADSPGHRERQVQVHPGDSLWSLVHDIVGPAAPPAEIARLVPVFYRTNRSKVGPDPDLILPGQQLTVPGPSNFPATSGGVFGDLDGDGRSDVLTSTWQDGPDGSKWRTHVSTGHAFSTRSAPPTQGKPVRGSRLVEGRFDADPRSEVYGYAAVSAGGDLELRPTTSGNPRLSLPLPENGTVGGVVSGNFDGTGHDDLAAFVRVPHGPAKILVYTNTGTTTPRFSTRPALWGTVGDVGSSVAVGDFDADGRDDVVTYQPGELDVAGNTSAKKSRLRLLTSTGDAFDVSSDPLLVDDEGQGAVVGLRSPAAPSTLLLVDTYDPHASIRQVPISGGRLSSPQRWAKGATAPGDSTFKYPGGDALTTGDFNGDGHEDLAEATSTYSSQQELQPIYVWLGHGSTGSNPHRWFRGHTKAEVDEMATRGMVTPSH